MDQFASPQSKSPQQNVKKFILVGLLEIGFVSILLTLLFSTLNYFHIIKISQYLPQFISYIQLKNSKFSSYDYFPVDNPSTARLLLTRYVNFVIKDKQISTTINNNLSNVQNLKSFSSFQLRLTSTNPKVDLSYAYDSQRKKIISLFIALSYTSPSATLSASQEIGKIFNIAKSSSSTTCKTDSNTHITTCGTFSSMSSEKEGYGVRSDIVKNQNIFFSCYIPFESPLFLTINNCIP